PAAIARDNDSGCDDRNDPRCTRYIGGEIRAIGEDQRDQDLQLRLAHDPKKGNRRDAGGKPDRGPEPGDIQEAQARIGRRWMTGEDRAEDRREDGDSGAVVEKALAVEDRLEATRRSDLSEQLDHRDRVGRGHDRAQQKATWPIEAEP